MSKEYELYRYLLGNHKGRKHAVHSKELEEKFDLCPRTVRNYVNALRKSGKPICSDETGYWVGINPKEVNHTIKRLDNFAGDVNCARTGLAFAKIQMQSVTRVTEENIHITIKVS